MSAEIMDMDAADLVGRLVINSKDREFVVTKVVFDAGTAQVVIWIRDIDEDDEHGGFGLATLDGFSIHQRLRSMS